MSSFSELRDYIEFLENQYNDMAERLVELGEIHMDDNGDYRWVSCGKIVGVPEYPESEIPF